jgi:maltooligosyltrehalose trehalohydrolase
MWSPDFCANVNDKNGVKFTVWAPKHESVSLVIYEKDGRRVIPMIRGDKGYFNLEMEDVSPGAEYKYVCGDVEVPDPASRFQPHGVHGPSRVVKPAFAWEDGSWKGVSRDDLVIYELHVGTFTPEGTFGSAALKLDHLVELGVTAVELMPVAQFAGARNWGYDGVFPYAVQNSYGGPDELKSFVNQAHKKGLDVVLDVVYNHVGPEGNYMDILGPYFSKRYSTPWGKSYNLDDAGSDEVRRFIVQNALYWVYEYHVDGLRLDAVHAIIDNSPKHIIQEICEAVKHAQAELGRTLVVIAESDLNDPKIVRTTERCGYGADAQWSDDFHHSLHVYLTGERVGYYQDFHGVEDLAKALTKVFVYDGVYSRFREKTHGAPVGDLDGCSFVVYSQNHDQIGNRADGSRMLTLVGELKTKMAAALTILSPYIPLIFMGEEYGETNPFYFFSDFTDQRIAEATRQGKKREMGEHYVDPQSPTAYERSKLDWAKTQTHVGKQFVAYYRNLISLRRQYRLQCKRNVQLHYTEKYLHMTRGDINLLLVFEESKVACGNWKLVESVGDFPKEVSTGEHTFRNGIAIYVKSR